MSGLLTIGQIADRLHEPPSRVTYIISKFRLKPKERVGIIRLFSEEQVKAIKNELYNIQIRQDKPTRARPALSQQELRT